MPVIGGFIFGAFFVGATIIAMVVTGFMIATAIMACAGDFIEPAICGLFGWERYQPTAIHRLSVENLGDAGAVWAPDVRTISVDERDLDVIEAAMAYVGQLNEPALRRRAALKVHKREQRQERFKAEVQTKRAAVTSPFVVRTGEVICWQCSKPRHVFHKESGACLNCVRAGAAPAATTFLPPGAIVRFADAQIN